MTQELDTLMYKMLSYAKRCMEDGAYASIGEMEAFGAPRIRGDDPLLDKDSTCSGKCSPHTRG